MLRRKIEDDLNKWRGIFYKWVRRFNIIMISILPKFMDTANAIPIKIVEIKLDLKFMFKYKRSKTAKATLESSRKIQH